MATFWDRAAYSAPFVFLLKIIFVISQFGLEGGPFVLIAPVPVHSLSFNCFVRTTDKQCDLNLLNYFILIK